jgi:hypothetical protein
MSKKNPSEMDKPSPLEGTLKPVHEHLAKPPARIEPRNASIRVIHDLKKTRN